MPSLSLAYFYYQGLNLILKKCFSNQQQPRYNPRLLRGRLSDDQGLVLPINDCCLLLQMI